MTVLGSSLLPKGAPPLALGTAGSFLRMENAERERLLDAYWDGGGRLFDTARAYGDGEAESILGLWMRRRRRADASVVTKIWHPSDPATRPSLRSLKSEVIDSLRHLRLDCVSAILLHRDPGLDVLTLAEWMSALTADSASLWGVSNFHTPRLEAFWHEADSRPSINSPQFSLPRSRQVLWPGTTTLDARGYVFHSREKLPLLAWSSLARGWMTDSGSGSPWNRAFDSPANRALRQSVRRLSSALSASPERIVLSWLLTRPFPVIPVIGTGCPNMIGMALDVCRTPLALHTLQGLPGWHRNDE